MPGIADHLDAIAHVRDFERAYLGPGVYVLYDGRPTNSNLVYIGKSSSEVLLRVKAHEDDKTFDRVGVILPARVDHDFVHTLEAKVMLTYADIYGELPPFNVYWAHPKPGVRLGDWTRVARRASDVDFD